MFVRTEAKFQM